MIRELLHTLATKLAKATKPGPVERAPTIMQRNQERYLAVRDFPPGSPGEGTFNAAGPEITQPYLPEAERLHVPMTAAERARYPHLARAFDNEKKPPQEAGVAHDPTAPAGAERVAQALASRTQPGGPGAARLPRDDNAIEAVIADVRRQVDRESAGHQVAEDETKVQDTPRRQARRRIKAAPPHGKICPGCSRRIGPRTRTCVCGHTFQNKKKPR